MSKRSGGQNVVTVRRRGRRTKLIERQLRIEIPRSNSSFDKYERLKLLGEHLIIESDQHRLPGFDGRRPKVAGGAQHIRYSLVR